MADSREKGAHGQVASRRVIRCRKLERGKSNDNEPIVLTLHMQPQRVACEGDGRALDWKPCSRSTSRRLWRAGAEAGFRIGMGCTVGSTPRHVYR
eukprot:556274-Prymnesium_polylepis.1